MPPLQSKPQPSTPTTMPGKPLQSQGVPTGAQANPGTEMATPEERQQLMELLEATREKMGELQTAKFSTSNAKEAAKLDALKEIFTMMQEAGVDLTSQESVAAFIERMKGANPTMAQMFEESLVSLLGEEGMDDVPVTPDSGLPTNPNQAFGGVMQGMSAPTNETLPENIRGSVPPTTPA